MKKKVQNYVKELGGEAKYSGKTQTMWIKGVNAPYIKSTVLKQFGTLPFKLEIHIK